MNNRTRNSVCWYLVFVTFNLTFEYPFEKCEICDMKDCKIFILNLTYVSVDSSSVYLFLHSPSLQLSTFAVVYVHIPMLSDSLCNGLGVSPSIRLSSNFAHAIIFRQKQLFLCNAWLPLSAVSWLMLDWCWLILFYDFAMISCQAYMLQCKGHEM